MCSLGLVLWEVLTQQRVYAEERVRYGKDDYLVSLHIPDFNTASFFNFVRRSSTHQLGFCPLRLTIDPSVDHYDA